MSVTVNPRVRELHTLLDLDDKAVSVMARAVDEQFRKLERDLFRTEGESEQLFWAPLSPRYKAWKDRWFAGMRTKHAKAKRVARLMAVPDRMGPKESLRGYAANKLLQLTGGLKRGLTQVGGEHVLSWSFSGTSASLTMGVTGRAGKIAAIHQEGGKYLPVRSMVKFTRQHQEELIQAARRALVPWALSRARAAVRGGASASDLSVWLRTLRGE